MNKFRETSMYHRGLVVVQSLSHVRLFVTPGTAAHQAPLSFTIFWSLLKLMSIESLIPSNHLILCCPISSHLQSFPASGSVQMSQFFTSGGQSIGVSASACPSKEYSGLLSFRMNWLDLFVVQGTLKSLLKHHSSKASILWHSAFFLVQLAGSIPGLGRSPGERNGNPLQYSCLENPRDGGAW